MDPVKALRKFNDNPKEVLDNARRGVKADLLDVINFWNLAGPKLLSLGVVSVLFHHLNGEKTPTQVTPGVMDTLDARHAWLALVGLTKLGNFFNDYVNPEVYDKEIIAAWPGVFKWSAFFYVAQIEPKTADPKMKRGAIDIITASWYSLCRSDEVRKLMVGTQGSVEIATQMWIIEDAGNAPSVIDIPSPTAALDALVKEDYPGSLDRIVKAAGGKADDVAQITLSRLRTAIKDPERIHEARTVIYLDFIIHLSRYPRHPLRYAFLNSNIITLCTNIALTVSELINSGGHPGLVAVMANAFGYLTNCLQSTEGFTWVTQSIKAGLLVAFVDCSPHFSKLDSEDQEMVLKLIKTIIPKYLVYRSVIQAVNGTTEKLSESPHRERVLGSIAKDAWISFERLALERFMLTHQAKAVKGKASTCDNVQCQKVDTKDNFRKCGGCQNTLYCSKECQVIAWKEGGHRTMCKLKQQESLEGKYQSISRGDAAFFHHLATRDARRQLPSLRRIAKKEYPDIGKTGLVVCINYTVHPHTFSLLPLADYKKKQPVTCGSPNAEARNEALIERAKENPGKFTIIQSKIANGQSLQIVLTVVTGSFWDDGKGLWGDDEGSGDMDEDSGLVKNIDGVDIAMARMALNGFLKSRGQPAVF